MHTVQGCAELCFIMEIKSCERTTLFQLMHDRVLSYIYIYFIFFFEKADCKNLDNLFEKS